MAHLEIITDRGADIVVPLSGDRFVVGREESCDLVLRDAQISRQHVLFRREDDGWLLEDLGSRNGATLNGQPAALDRLESGDLVGIGSTQLRFQAHEVEEEAVQVLDVGRVTRLRTGNVPEVGSSEKLRLLLEIAGTLDSFESPEKLLEKCGKLVVSIFHPACCALCFDDATWGYSQRLPDENTGLPPDMSQTVLARVKRGEVLLVRDTLNEPDLSQVASVHSFGIRSAMAAPLLVAGRQAGFIYVDQRRFERFFSEDDLAYLVGLCRLVGAAFDGSNRFLRLDAENRLLRARGKTGQIVGESPAVAQLRQQIEERVAPVNASVLLLGETGTGKSLVAQTIHLASQRRSGPFVEVNCAAIPSELIESELFGHEKGAFSGATATKKGQFELAAGGTLFLDEIGELAAGAQAKLLMVVQNRRLQRVGATKPIDVDVRIVAATNRDLAREVKESRFRADLYYRLNVVTLQIPPLRARQADIPALADHFLTQACRDIGRRVVGFTDDAMALLVRHDWPGNARELSNCVERAVIFGDDGDKIDVDHLPPEIREREATSEGLDPLAEKERDMIVEALQQSSGNKRQAARILGWYPQKLYSRLKRYGIEAG